MKTPHKHAALIKAWADGAKIQILNNDGQWKDVTDPAWLDYMIYRIKPKTIKYRLYIYRRSDWISPMRSVHICTDPTATFSYESSSTFIKWLGDWQEVEV
jgi:hypothetical protein